MVRLNKYLADNAGVSRREADRLIDKGLVKVDGETAVKGMVVDEDVCRIVLDGSLVTKRSTGHYFALNKPCGYISSTVKQGREDRIVTELIDTDIRLFPAGRLDKDSEGLIIMTDDGDLTDRILRSRNGHEKEYITETSCPVPMDIIEKIRSGSIDIGEGRLTKPCRISCLSDKRFDIILTEGMNRQIRKMFGTFGYKVTSLKRIRFMNIKLDGLKSGEYRELTDQEIKKIREMTRDE